MFDEHQPGGFQPHVKPPLVLLTCAGVSLLLSFGLCGMGGGMSSVGFRGALTESGFFLFFAAVVAVLIGSLWLLVVVIINAFRS